MEELSYDDDGIPVVNVSVDDNHSPAHSKRRRRKPSSAFVVDNGSSSDNTVTSVPDKSEVEVEEQPGSRYHLKCEDSKAVFTIDGVGYDVTLSEKTERILWSPMNAAAGVQRKKSAKKRASVFKGRRPSITTDANVEGMFLSDLIGAQVKRKPKPGREQEGICLGLVLSLPEHKDENTLREKTVFMEHPSEELCATWHNRIMNYIKSKGSASYSCQRVVRHNRPRVVKLFLQPFAGNKTGRNIYTRTILPIFKSADLSVDLFEIAHNESVKQEMAHMNMDDYDCIVCMGGDGTVSQVVDVLTSKIQKEADINMKQGAHPVKVKTPVGIIPTGRTNNIAQSVMGVADAVTGAFHIILGNFHPVDVCSIQSTENFLKWGFNAQYGFAGQVLNFMRRYKSLGSKRVDAAFIKALTKSKLRAYECDIEYIPAEKTPGVKSEPCRTGCSVCKITTMNTEEPEDKVCDLVQDFDPLNQSMTSNGSSIIELAQDSPWCTLKGKYMNVGLFVQSGVCDIAPQGLSKSAHLNDGIIQLVLVKEVEKKEFVRHLKRHGNSKNQFDFPFIDVIRVKELRLRPRFPISWNYNDHDFNEIKYQMEREESKLTTGKSLEVIDDLDSDDDFATSQSMDNLDLSGDDSDGGSDQPKEEQPRLVGPQYRKTFTEIEIARRRKIARKKEEKQKAREESKMLSVWNIDNQMETRRELDFKVHNGLIQISGVGISPHTDHDDVRLSCLPG